MQNKIGIVTAAGSGMGRAGAIRFAKEGASVAVVDLNADAAAAVVKDITDAGGKAMAISGDLTDDAFARNIVRDTVRAYGGLDFVWNHVGHPGPPARRDAAGLRPQPQRPVRNLHPRRPAKPALPHRGLLRR
jgi:NAD(P)-dependent dehydrogenase (short-subunit alcohol dehydrogenase family)